MLFDTVDSIARRTLLELGLPVHYYFERLVHSVSAVRELSFDTLKIVNTVELPVNEYNAIDLPDDFVDDVGLSYGRNGFIRKLHHTEYINPLRYHDSTGTYIKPPQAQFAVNGQGFFGLRGLGWYWNINEYGEPTGRFFGARGASDRDGYQVIRERRQIQLTNDAPCDTAVLMYISNGQNADNATQVDTRAHACIRAYGDWMSSPQAGVKNSPLGQSYYASKRELRARLDELTNVDIIHAVRRSYTAAIKS